MKDKKIAYFGGEPLGLPVLEELAANGIVPNLIVCNPDRPSGRGHVLTPPPVKIWAIERDIAVFQPESLKDKNQLAPLTETDWDVFIVVAYNHILPEWLIELPTHKTLNVHPSLLPKLRGPSPIRTAILNDERDAIGVSVMLMDSEMDHGPILAQLPMQIADENWPMSGGVLDEALAHRGGTLLADTVPKWLDGKIDPQPQNHELATYTQKMSKADGALMLDPQNLPTGENAHQMLLKIKAYDGWPSTYFIHKGKRVKITDASLDESGALKILRIIPEGKKEVRYDSFINS